MKAILSVWAVLALVANSAHSKELKRLNLDDAASLGTIIQTDTEVKAEGKGSIRITTQGPTTIFLGEVAGLDVENAKLVYRARVKTDLDGAAYLEMWAHLGGRQFFSRGTDNAVKQKTDWTAVQTPFLFQKGQNPEKLTLNLVVNGKGTVWIDDIVMSKEPLE